MPCETSAALLERPSAFTLGLWADGDTGASFSYASGSPGQADGAEASGAQDSEERWSVRGAEGLDRAQLPNHQVSDLRAASSTCSHDEDACTPIAHGGALVRTIPKAIDRQRHPAALAAQLEPGLVRSIPGQMVVVDLDLVPCLPDPLRQLRFPDRAIEEERDGITLRAGGHRALRTSAPRPPARPPDRSPGPVPRRIPLRPTGRRARTWALRYLRGMVARTGLGDR